MGTLWRHPKGTLVNEFTVNITQPLLFRNPARKSLVKEFTITVPGDTRSTIAVDFDVMVRGGRGHKQSLVAEFSVHVLGELPYNILVGVDGVARQVVQMFYGVDGKAVDVVDAFVGVDDRAVRIRGEHIGS